LVKRHIEEKEKKQDILSFVVKAKDPITGTMFDFEELQLNAQTLLYMLISSDGTDGVGVVPRRVILRPQRYLMPATFY